MATAPASTPAAAAPSYQPITPVVVNQTPATSPVARPTFTALHRDQGLTLGVIHVLGVNLIRGTSRKNGQPYEIPQLVVSGLDGNGMTAAGGLQCSREVIAKVTQVGMYRYATGLSTQRDSNDLALRVTDVEFVK